MIYAKAFRVSEHYLLWKLLKTIACQTQIPVGPLNSSTSWKEVMGSVLQRGSVDNVHVRHGLPCPRQQLAAHNHMSHNCFTPLHVHTSNQHFQSISIKLNQFHMVLRAQMKMMKHHCRRYAAKWYKAGHLGFQVASNIKARAEVGMIQMRQYLSQVGDG